MIDLLSMLDECEIRNPTVIDHTRTKYWFKFHQKYNFQPSTEKYNILWYHDKGNVTLAYDPDDTTRYHYFVEIFDDEMNSIIKLML